MEWSYRTRSYIRNLKWSFYHLTRTSNQLLSTDRYHCFRKKGHSTSVGHLCWNKTTFRSKIVMGEAIDMLYIDACQSQQKTTANFTDSNIWAETIGLYWYLSIFSDHLYRQKCPCRTELCKLSQGYISSKKHGAHKPLTEGVVDSKRGVKCEKLPLAKSLHYLPLRQESIVPFPKWNVFEELITCKLY